MQKGRSRGDRMETAGEDKQGRGGEAWVGALKGSRACLAFTFFLFLGVAVALVFDEAGAGRASSAGHALQTPLHQLAQLDS